MIKLFHNAFLRGRALSATLSFVGLGCLAYLAHSSHELVGVIEYVEPVASSTVVTLGVPPVFPFREYFVALPSSGGAPLKPGAIIRVQATPAVTTGQITYYVADGPAQVLPFGTFLRSVSGQLWRAAQNGSETLVRYGGLGPLVLGGLLLLGSACYMRLFGAAFVGLLGFAATGIGLHLCWINGWIEPSGIARFAGATIVGLALGLFGWYQDGWTNRVAQRLAAATLCAWAAPLMALIAGVTSTVILGVAMPFALLVPRLAIGGLFAGTCFAIGLGATEPNSAVALIAVTTLLAALLAFATRCGRNSGRLQSRHVVAVNNSTGEILLDELFRGAPPIKQGVAYA